MGMDSGKSNEKRPSTFFPTSPKSSLWSSANVISCSNVYRPPRVVGLATLSSDLPSGLAWPGNCVSINMIHRGRFIHYGENVNQCVT